MSFLKCLNVWVFMYSVNMSLLFTGIAFQFIPSARHNLISTQGFVFFIFINVIVFGAFRKFMYADMIRPWFVSSSNCMVNFSAMKLTKKFIAPL